MNKAGTSPALTSPAASGVFLFLSATPCNRAAQAPRRPAEAGLPSALPLSPFRPVPPRLVKARPLSAPSALAVRRPPLVIHARTLPPPLPRAALCRAGASLPLPLAVRPAWKGTATPCRRPYAGNVPRRPPATAAAGDPVPRRRRPPAVESGVYET